MAYLLVLGGLTLLIVGAEALVRGASRLAASLGISPLVVGLTVVAFGTSAPELMVSVLASMEGAAGADIAVGNVVGSNIFNVLFIVGVSALVTPLAVAHKLVRIDVPLMIAASVCVFLLGMDGMISRAEGLGLFAAILVYTVFAIRQGRREGRALDGGHDAGGSRDVALSGTILQLALVGGGLLLLIVGSRWLVTGAVALASDFGVSELMISLTIVAAGTSLPEVATSVLASIRGAREIAVGNVVGSNLFNLLAVLGLSASVAPDGVVVSGSAIGFDFPVMIATAVVCLPVFFTGLRIGRLEGALFLAYYVAYVSYLVLDAGRDGSLPLFSAGMLYAVIPATVLVLLVAVIRQFRRT